MTSDAVVEYREFATDFKDELREEFRGIRTSILILGPSLSGEPLEPQADLRRVLLERCQAYGVAVAGEHKSLVSAARRASKAGHNLCSYEFELARKCDVIVIIPTSAGSLVELGLFALNPDITIKCIVLFDENRKEDNSFVRHGARKAYRDGNAQVLNVDYSNVDFIWRKVETRIELARQRIRNRKLTGGMSASA